MMHFMKTCRELVALICFVTCVQAQNEFFKNVSCNLYSCNAVNCSWDLPNPVVDLRFVYRLSKHHADDIEDDKESECSHYLGTSDTGRQGCHLGGLTPLHMIDYTISGTLNGTTVNSSYVWEGLGHIIPPRLQLAAKQENNHLQISWMNHDLYHCNLSWKFLINYTVCNNNKTPETAVEPKTSVLLPFNPDCQYNISVTISSSHTKYRWTETIKYGETTNPFLAVYAAAILLPLMFAAFAILLFVFFRKYKDKIFPKVPEPGKFLQDVLCDNNVSLMRELSVPNQEEVDTPILLVLDTDS